MAAERSRERVVRTRRRRIAGLMTTAVVAAVGTTLGVTRAGVVHAQPRPASSCVLSTPKGQVSHVINLAFDNVHFTRDNPNVPSDLEQMPHLLNFIEGNGVLLSNMHTPLIAHTADDIVTTLTGVYGDKHGQPVSNSYRVYNNGTNGTTAGGSVGANSFVYWTDPVSAFGATSDTAPSMVTPAGKNAPAPWVPYTRAGCDVGAFSTANLEVESANPDLKATILSLVGLHDDYTSDGRVLVEDVAHSFLANSFKDQKRYQDLVALETAYKQLNADVGTFADATLRASTTALEDTSTSQSTYQTIENELATLDGERDSLAAQIETLLDDVEFNGQNLNINQAQTLTQQANDLIAQAQSL